MTRGYPLGNQVQGVREVRCFPDAETYLTTSHQQALRMILATAMIPATAKLIMTPNYLNYLRQISKIEGMARAW